MDVDLPGRELVSLNFAITTHQLSAISSLLSLEIEIGRHVQERLLRTAPTHLRTLECTARCIQTKSVGGEYYHQAVTVNL